MESYLANIDNYMKQHEEEMLLNEQQQPTQQQSSQQQPQQSNTPPSVNVTHDEWVLRSPQSASTASSFFNDIESFLNQDTQLFIPNVQLDYIPTNYAQPLHPWLDANTARNSNNNHTTFSSSLLNTQNTSAANPSLIHHQQPQQHQPAAPPRRKPGRKPNPAAPALRKAQNRAAQRAFRERKERHVHELETKIQTLQEKNEKLNKDLNSVKTELESYKAETWYLKGLVLTLQFICMHHNIKIPSHSPYLPEHELAKMAKIAPHTTAAYAKAYTNNNKNLKSTLAYHYMHSLKKQKNDDDDSTMSTDDPSSPPAKAPNNNNSMEVDTPEYKEWWLEQKEHQIPGQLPAHPNLKASLKAIEEIRRKLGVQSSLYSTDKSAARLRPTMLQLAVPHDSRIDLIPMPHMRDRMILFRSQMDYDKCFSIMISKGIFHGGDPTLSKNWEMPAEFFSEFWYLTLDYDIKRTNHWRRRQGLPEIEAGPPRTDDETVGLASIETFYQHPTEAKIVELWESNLWSQVLQDMPDLQPLNEATYPMSPPKMDIYENLMESPETRIKLEDPPTLENILKVMGKLSISQEGD